MDWSDKYNQIVCELMAQQVRKGNTLNTQLNTLGYTEVSNFFPNDRNNQKSIMLKKMMSMSKGILFLLFL
jgi:hypothetical protein